MNHLPYSLLIPPARIFQRLIPLLAAVLLLQLIHVPVAFAAEFPKERQEREMRTMLDTIRAYGLHDEKVLESVSRVPRHLFVPERNRRYSYRDSPLEIGYGQTISQPYIVAEMTRLLDLSPDAKVLEIGTGSGYQAAVLGEMGVRVYSIEILKPLHEQAGKNLKAAGYSGVSLRHGDGYYGWPEAAPFQAIIVTAAAGQIPPPLLDQLAPGGRMVIPVGRRFGTQHLILVNKNRDGTISSSNIMPVRFVPLVRK
jgi:protein-L-isoaspartate(D-aspartate) O-methyltransferase